MIVYTGGTFDCFHNGHVRLLKACSILAGEEGKVFVGLNTDEFIKKYKGKPPVMNFDERKEVLLSCKYVFDVVENIGNEDSKQILEVVKPHIVVVGSDWAKKDYYKQMDFTQFWLDENEIQLVYVPYTEGISTTEVKRRINER